jgi:hypothetical protein
MKELILGITATLSVLVCMGSETSEPASMQSIAVAATEDHQLKTIEFPGFIAELPAG